MASVKRLKIGEILVKENILTREQVQQILKHQSQLKEPKRFGDICIELGLMWKNDLKDLIKKYCTQMLIGELFIHLDLINQKELEAALVKQKETKKRLGDVLVEMEFVTEENIAEALSIQLDIPKIDPNIGIIDENLLKKINEKYLKKNNVIPAFKEDDALILIMEDPLQVDDMKFFEKIFSCKVKPAVSTKRAIKNALYEFFDDLEDKEKKKNISVELIIGEVEYPHGKDKVVDLVNYFIGNAIKENASDLHLEPQFNRLMVRYRIDGILIHKTDLPISFAPSLASRIKVLASLDIAEKRKHQDGRVGIKALGKDFDLRISTYASLYGETIVIRFIPRQSKLVDLTKIGLSKSTLTEYEKNLNHPSGVMLITGPTGSGKTTTLYASIAYLNDMRRKIITVEDPIENVIPGVTQGSVNEIIGMSYVDFLKSMMRQDPDVIMIGEIREKESAEVTVQAALTGHKVFSTFHTDDTTGALLRLMDMGIETFLISSTVVSVMAQRLVRVICKECKEKYNPPMELLEPYQIRGGVDFKKHSFFRGKGCGNCNSSGFKGRTGIYELLVVNDPIRNAILAKKTSSEIRDVARRETGLISLKEDGFYKALKGFTTLDEVSRVVYHKESDESLGRTVEEIVSLCEGAAKTKKSLSDYASRMIDRLLPRDYGR